MTEALEKKSIQFVTLFDTRPYHFMGKVMEADRKKFELVTIVTDRTSHNTSQLETRKSSYTFFFKDEPGLFFFASPCV